MAKPDLGTKRVCPSCTARFYDLQKRPIECPKCAFTFEPEALLKQRRTRVPEPAPKAAPVIVAEDEDAEESEDEEAEEETAEAEDEEVEEAVEVVEAPVEADADAENEDGEPAVVDTAETEDDFEDEIDDDDEEDDDTLLEEVEEDEDDVAGIIDADIEKDEP